MASALGCARCGRPSTTVVVGFSALYAYLDLCEEHLREVLDGARRVEPGSPSSAERRRNGEKHGQASVQAWPGTVRFPAAPGGPGVTRSSRR
jgi:hypothetical protein